MPNSPTSCVAVPTSGCIDLQYTSNGKCTASASTAKADSAHSPSMPPNCDFGQDQNQCKAETARVKDRGGTGACNWTPGGQQEPWHSRNGISNTCVAFAKYKYCTSDYFNTYGGVKVTSAEACCGCGGGSTFCGIGATRSVSGNDFICSCNAAYSGSAVTNGVATCVEKTCTDSDGAKAAANCGSGASCSNGSVDDGYKVSEILSLFLLFFS